MAKDFNIQKLTVGMSLRDKANLLFADKIKRVETNDKEWVLTPSEKAAIWQDAHKNKQTRELGKLVDKYNVAVSLYDDAKTVFKMFNIFHEVFSFLDTMLGPIKSKARMIELMLRFNVETFEKPIKNNGISPYELKIFSLREAKTLALILYKMKKLMASEDVNFLSEKMAKTLEEYEHYLKSIYANEYTEKFIQLNEEETAKADQELDWLLERFSRINFDTS